MGDTRARTTGTPDALARALFNPQAKEEDQTMAEADIASITGDLDLTAIRAELGAMTARAAALEADLVAAKAETAARDAVIVDLRTKIKSMDDAMSGMARELDSRPPAPQPKQPQIRLTAPHGFIDEETGIRHDWHTGQTVTNPADITLLRERSAPIEDI